MENVKELIAIAMTALAGIAAWFNLKSDVRSQDERLGRTESLTASVLENAQRIRDLEHHRATADESRANQTRILEKLEDHMQRQDLKLDSLRTAITEVDTKLQERTKELHS